MRRKFVTTNYLLNKLWFCVGGGVETDKCLVSSTELQGILETVKRRE